MKEPNYEDLKIELAATKNILIGKYLNMLAVDQHHGKDEMELLEEFIDFFTKSQNKFDNYKEYMVFLRSYILLSHAAIEEFIESTIKYYLNASEEIYKNTQRSTILLQWFLLKSEYAKKYHEKNFEETISSLKAEFFAIVNENHGIKKHNLEKLFYRVGINGISYEPFELLGGLRGNFAHYGGKSAHLSLKSDTPINPYDLVKMVEDVIYILENEILTKFKASIL